MPSLGVVAELVGRRAELAQLRTALTRADDRQASAVLMSGEAGVGKSRLATALAEEAESAGALVLTGRCLDIAEHDLPYLAFADALGGLLGRDDDAVAAAVGARPALGRLLPHVNGVELPAVDRAPALATLGLPGPLPTDRDLGQLQLFDGVLGVLSELAQLRLVVLVIEDLHWADAGTRDLLAFVLGRLRRERLLVLATYRSDDVHRTHPVRPLLAQLTRMPSVERLELGPFPDADARAFVAARADRPLSADAVDGIVRRSEGNAFFAEELLASGAHRADIPGGLADVLLSRLERLSPAAQHVLRIAAVADGGATHSALADVVDLDDGALDAALREAVQHHVLVVSGTHYRFRHALLREAVYGDLLPGERVRTHAAFARRLIGGADAGQAALLAYHAMESHDLPTALAASVQAAEDAERSGAPDAGLRNVERALRIWPSVPAEQRPDDVGELDLLQEAAYFAGTVGEQERAIAHARAAVRLLASLDESDVTSEWAAVVWRRLALSLGRSAGVYREAMDAIERAWQLVADAEPSSVRAWVLATRAALQRQDNQFAVADDTARAAVADARASGTLGAEADALCTLAVVAEDTGGDLAQARQWRHEARTKAARAPAPLIELRAIFGQAIADNEAGELSRALDAYREGEARAVELGLQWSTTGREIRAHIVTLRYVIGDWPQSDPAAEDRGAPGSIIDRIAAAYVPVLVGRGSWQQADGIIDDLKQRWQSEYGIALSVGAARVELALWRADAPAAMRHAVTSLEWLEQFEPVLEGGIRVAAHGLHAAAKVVAGARRRSDAAVEAEAVAVADRLSEHVAACVANSTVRGSPLGPEGVAWQLRAEAEHSGVRQTPDPKLWQRTVDAFGYGAAYEQAVCRWRYAEAVLATEGDHAVAAGELAEAKAVAQRLGAGPLRAAVDDLAVRARVGTGVAREPTAGPLTARERAVLELVAVGKTNREIGADLFISDKTVSVHLSRAMAKLGASRRAEAVAAAYDAGLL